LSQHPRHFPQFWLSLVRAGEESGKLVACLEKLADFEERLFALRRQVVSILVYPAMMALVCVGLLALFFGFLLPRIEEILDLFDGKMPALTVGLITVAHVATHPLTLLAALFVVPASTYALGRRYRQQASFRRAVDEWAFRHRILGSFLVPMCTARIFYAWSLLLEAGVTLEPQVRVLADVAANEFLRGRIDDAYKLMKAGTDLYESLAIQEVLPKHALAMVRVGEESGMLTSSMRYVARMYEESVERRLNDMAAALEPLMIGGMGLVVGLVALATALPILNLVGQL
jgi:type II secretory pathway component PulF